MCSNLVCLLLFYQFFVFLFCFLHLLEPFFFYILILYKLIYWCLYCWCTYFNISSYLHLRILYLLYQRSQRCCSIVKQHNMIARALNSCILLKAIYFPLNLSLIWYSLIAMSDDTVEVWCVKAGEEFFYASQANNLLTGGSIIGLFYEYYCCVYILSCSEVIFQFFGQITDFHLRISKAWNVK